MFGFFRAIVNRLKAMFINNAALDLEAEFLTRDAERKAELLRLAEQYQKEGLVSIAQELRQQAQALSLQRPLASVLPALDHVVEEKPGPSTPRLRVVTTDNKLPSNGLDQPTLTFKKGRKA